VPSVRAIRADARAEKKKEKEKSAGKTDQHAKTGKRPTEKTPEDAAGTGRKKHAAKAGRQGKSNASRRPASPENEKGKAAP